MFSRDKCGTRIIVAGKMEMNIWEGRESLEDREVEIDKKCFPTFF
jgi:hypothetical protein